MRIGSQLRATTGVLSSAVLLLLSDLKLPFGRGAILLTATAGVGAWTAAYAGGSALRRVVRGVLTVALAFAALQCAWVVRTALGAGKLPLLATRFAMMFLSIAAMYAGLALAGATIAVLVELAFHALTIRWPLRRRRVHA